MHNKYKNVRNHHCLQIIYLWNGDLVIGHYSLTRIDTIVQLILYTIVHFFNQLFYNDENTILRSIIMETDKNHTI